MDKKVKQSRPGMGGQGPLIVLFSPRERIRDILAVGLTQCDYRVILAESPYLASIKTSQFLPDMVIADITANNTNDILLVSRLQRSIRTRKINTLIILPNNLLNLLDQLNDQNDTAGSFYHVIEYPFNFSDLLTRIKSVLFHTEQALDVEESDADGEEGISIKGVARMLVDTTVGVLKKLESIEQALNKQWAFPFAVIKALDIIESDASCCTELANCISVDPGASAAILKVANTVHYAKRGRRVTEVKDAVVRLGFRETRNLLACLALIDLSPDLYKSYGFSRYDFWLHSLSVALIAEKLCDDSGFRRPELAFIAGLVHDLGKIPLDNKFSALFSRLLEKTTEEVSGFYAVEEQELGFSHTDLGQYLTTRWNFPETITGAILNHHNPDRILAIRTPADRVIQEAVFMANILTKAMNLGHSCDEIIHEIPAEMLRDFKLVRGPSDRFFTTIFRNLGYLCKHLDLSLKNLVLAKKVAEHDGADILVVLNKSVSYHPIVSALTNNGYPVKVASQFVPELHGKAQIIITLPEKGYPIDIMLYEDDVPDRANRSILKIFLLDVVPEKKVMQSFEESDIVFFDKHSLDMRMLMHTIDNFLGTVVTPERMDLDDQEPEKLE